MSDTDALTLATQAVAGVMSGMSPDSPERLARAALDAVGVLAAGTQPNPVGNDHPSCHDLAIERLHTYWAPEPGRDRLIEDLTLRREFGRRKYGRPLQPHNGRSAVADAYAEVLDLVVYLVQLAEEGGAPSLAKRAVTDLLDSTTDIALRLAEAQQ